jgi:hypothetical protein
MVGDKAAAMTGVVGEGELCPLHLEQEQEQNSYETSESAQHWYGSRWPLGPIYPLQVMLLIPTIAKRRIPQVTLRSGRTPIPYRKALLEEPRSSGLGNVPPSTPQSVRQRGARWAPSI